MVNVTVTVPEDLKTEMDKYPEVNWSEVFRTSIAGYIEVRRNPSPPIDLNLTDVTYDFDVQMLRPRLFLNIRINNRTSKEIIVDRVLVHAFFSPADNPVAGQGGLNCNYLRLLRIPANNAGVCQIELYLSRRLVMHIATRMKSSFLVRVYFVVGARDYPAEYQSNANYKMPIDEWRQFATNVDQALLSSRATQQVKQKKLA